MFAAAVREGEVLRSFGLCVRPSSTDVGSLVASGGRAALMSRMPVLQRVEMFVVRLCFGGVVMRLCAFDVKHAHGEA